MSDALIIPRFTVGVGNRFAHRARVHFSACFMAPDVGSEVIPVRNKSDREHDIVDSEGSHTRASADSTEEQMHWMKPCFVDTDDLILGTTEPFAARCDFFTLDVAERVGGTALAPNVYAFVKRHIEVLGPVVTRGSWTQSRSTGAL